MQSIRALLIEPIGCLADFPGAPFHEIAGRYFGRKGKASPSASRNYWHLLNLMEAAVSSADAALFEESQISAVEALEIEAIAAASLYEDVRPMLVELKSLDVQLALTTSLSRAATEAFLSRHSLAEFFGCVMSRDDAGGVKSIPLMAALDEAQIAGDGAIYLTDTLEGIKAARAAGVHPILMMNDPDEAQRLAHHHPDGGVVSLHEIPDFVRLVAAQNASA
jgi:phosphoglycolate phosphatase-like HAD superfamily hydrolase